MLGKTHRAFGMAVTAGALWIAHSRIPAYEELPSLVGNGQVLATAAGAYLGSTLPDIDKLLPVHRGITHAIWVPMALFIGAFHERNGNPFLFAALVGLFLGYLSHLVGDAYSIAGVAWFYPFQRYERYPSGAFYVKGPRGPFIPLYEVGSGKFSVAPVWWYTVAGILLSGWIADMWGLLLWQ